MGSRAVLTREEEKELARRMREGDEAAREKFILRNLLLVISIAVKYQRNGVPLSDTIQMGMEGLVRAVEDFDWEREVRFSTYATWWIRQGMLRGNPQQERMIHLPARQENRVRKYMRRKEKTDATGETRKNDGEIFDEMGLAERSRRFLLKAIQAFAPPMSIDGSLLSFSSRDDGEGVTLGETIPDERVMTEEGLIEAMDRKERVDEILGLEVLTGKEREVLLALYGFEDGEPKTLQQTGDRFGVSRERIRQIEKRALRKIRTELGVPEPQTNKGRRRPQQEA